MASQREASVKPCPFCGAAVSEIKIGPAMDERDGYTFPVTIACKCGGQMRVVSNVDKNGWCKESVSSASDRAIASWNRRKG